MNAGLAPPYAWLLLAELLVDVSSPGLMLSIMAEVRLAARLHALGLLPEVNRLEFVRTVSQYAIEGRDTDALDNATIRGVFTESEHAALVAQVRAQLLPKLHSVRIEYQGERRCYQYDTDLVPIIRQQPHFLRAPDT